MNFLQFHNPYMFLVLWVTILLVVFLHIHKNKKSNFLHSTLLKTAQWKRKYQTLIFWWNLYCIMSLIILLLAWPYTSYREVSYTQEGIDIMMVMDLSYSMTAEDIWPNRLEVAKELSQDFIQSRESDRVWLVLFAGITFMAIPLVQDYRYIWEYLEQVNIKTIDQDRYNFKWTATWDALVLAGDILNQSETDREKVIVLITDGEANRGIKPSLALGYIKEKNIKIYSIGVWNNTKDTVEIPNKNAPPDVEVVWDIDAELLQKLASETDWVFFRAQDKVAFSNALKRIAQLEKKSITSQVVERKRDFSLIIAIAMILLIFFQWVYAYIYKLRLW